MKINKILRSRVVGAVSAVALMVGLTSCPADDEVDVAREVWRESNSYTTDVRVYTVYDTGSEITPSGYVDVVATVPIKGYVGMKGTTLELRRDEELDEHPELTMYFVLPTEAIGSDLSRLRERYVARVTPTREWMEEHGWTVRFPDDTEVNPRLGDIYDLDKMVDYYGPFNAIGWDTLWTQWQQSRK